MRSVSLAAAITAVLSVAAVTVAMSPAASATAAPALPAGKAFDGYRVHIVSFVEPPAPLFRGFHAHESGRPDLAPVAIDLTGAAQYDPERPEAVAYLDYLAERRDQRLAAAESAIGRDIQPLFVYEHALNGIAVSLRADEAERIAALPGVRAVTQDVERFPMTERGPVWIKAPEIWNGTAGVSSRGEGIVVGVVDTGIISTHPSFAASAGGFTHTNPRAGFLGFCATSAGACNNKLIGIYDFVSSTDGRSSNAGDPSGHGTHVASIAAGNPVNTTFGGIPLTLTGVAPRANLISYRGCGSTADSSGCGGSAPLLASINQAIADRVDVINYSIGGDPNDPFASTGGGINTDEEAFLAAREAGIVVAVAAGNDGPNPGTLSSPANAPWVMAVANVTHDRSGPGDRLVASSGRGPVPSFGVVKPDVAAPGFQIRAADHLSNGAASRTGTSMAAPHVAGAAALLRAARPSWGADQIISALTLTARPDTILGQADGAATTPHDRGAGTVDLALAANAALSLNVPAGAFRNGSNATASSLNLPSLAAGHCVEACVLTRTLSAMPGTSGGQFEVIANVPAGLGFSVSPSTFTLAAGGSRSLDFRFSVNAQSELNRWAYGSVSVRRVGGGTPELRLPVAIFLSAGEVPPLQQRNVAADRGFVDFNLGRIIALPNARFDSTDLATPVVREGALAQDSTNSDPYDAAGGGTFFEVVPVNYGDGRRRDVAVLVSLAPSSSPPAQDFDLYVGVDADANGQPSLDEERCRSVSPGNTESCTLTIVHTGNNFPIRVWAVAQNWRASSPGVSNSARLDMVAVDTLPSARQAATGPGNVPANGDFTARLVYDDPTLLNGQSRYGFLLVDRGPNANAIRVPFQLTRTTATPAPYALGLGVNRSVTLPAGAAHDGLFVDVPAGATALTVSTESSANVDLFLARVAPVVPTEGLLPTIAAAPARSAANASAATPSGNETITVNNPAAGRWYVTPVNASTAVANATVRATLTGTAPAIRPGGYFNPGRSGHGLFIHPSSTVLAGLWYTYLQDGTPTWYYLQGDAPGSNGVWRGQLFRSAWNGSANVLTEVGSGIISPTATNEFVFSYNIDGETGSEAFRSFGGACPTLSGAPLNVSAHWFNPARSGTGYSVQLFPDDEFHAIFGYDALGQPRFLTAELGRFGGATASMDLLQVSGFCPLCPRNTEPVRTPIGSFSRSFANGSFGNITFSGTYINGVPGTWSANEGVQPLGGLQGCTP